MNVNDILHSDSFHLRTLDANECSSESPEFNVRLVTTEPFLVHKIEGRDLVLLVEEAT